MNPSDILFMRGKYTGIKLNGPYTPGWEGSGVVEAVGSKLQELGLVGKRVAFMKQGEMLSYKIGGAMADYCVTSIGCVIPIPDEPGLTFEKAASFFVNPLSAVCMVERVVELGASACIVTAASS